MLKSKAATNALTITPKVKLLYSLCRLLFGNDKGSYAMLCYLASQKHDELAKRAATYEERPEYQKYQKYSEMAQAIQLRMENETNV